MDTEPSRLHSSDLKNKRCLNILRLLFGLICECLFFVCVYCSLDLLRDVDHYYDLWRSLQNCGEANAGRRSRSVTRMQQSLIQAQELGDEKMQIVTQLQELIDHKTRQLDTDQKNLDIKEEKEDIIQMQIDESGAPTPQKQSRTQSPARGGDLASLSGAMSNGK